MKKDRFKRAQREGGVRQRRGDGPCKQELSHAGFVATPRARDGGRRSRKSGRRRARSPATRSRADSRRSRRLERAAATAPRSGALRAARACARSARPAPLSTPGVRRTKPPPRQRRAGALASSRALQVRRPRWPRPRRMVEYRRPDVGRRAPRHVVPLERRRGARRERYRRARRSPRRWPASPAGARRGWAALVARGGCRALRPRPRTPSRIDARVVVENDAANALAAAFGATGQCSERSPAPASRSRSAACLPNASRARGCARASTSQRRPDSPGQPRVTTPAPAQVSRSQRPRSDDDLARRCNAVPS